LASEINSATLEQDIWKSIINTINLYGLNGTLWVYSREFPKMKKLHDMQRHDLRSH